MRGVRPAQLVGLLAASACAQDFRALVFTKTAGFRHSSIPSGIAAIQQLAADNCFAVEASEDSALFNPVDLARFQVVIFLSTTGDILSATEQQAFETWFSAAHGWVGIHAAADTEYTWPFYGSMMGAYFASHPVPQQASLIVEDAIHTSTAFLPNPWTRFDEWYNFQQNPRPNVRVLLRLDESTYTGGAMGPDHPIAWCHAYQGGLAWYTGGGHTEESYAEPLFVRHVLGGILWAAGADGCACYANCDASTTPPILNVNDFGCFLNRFATGDPYANCDQSTIPPVLNVADFSCFLNRFAAGCG